MIHLRAKVRRVTGATEHWLGGVDDEGNLKEVAKLPDAHWVELKEGGQGFFLLYFDEAGEYITDGWHVSLEEAKHQAKFEFEINENDWRPVP
jgi:hypothetical protein